MRPRTGFPLINGDALRVRCLADYVCDLEEDNQVLFIKGEEYEATVKGDVIEVMGEKKQPWDFGDPTVVLYFFRLLPASKIKAKEITVVTVRDPDSGNDVDVQIFKEECGPMGGIDASYLEQDVDVAVSPHNNGEIEWEDE